MWSPCACKIVLSRERRGNTLSQLPPSTCAARRPAAPCQVVSQMCLAVTAEMFVEPVRDQPGVSLPSGICMPNSFAHNQSGRNFRIAEVLDKGPRLPDRYSPVLITVDENRWRIISGHVSNGRQFS